MATSPPDDPPGDDGTLDPTVIGDFGRLADDPLEEPGTPRWIGRYRVLEVIGQGGMGTVYLAEQERPIRRRVAVKLIRSTQPDRHTTHRFEAERQALARMSHPSIAQVYEAGNTESGQPFFAMEHVPGEPITAYCDRHATPIEERLRLFAEVCRGIQHAHQKGVLHRDIKPENVLVADEQGRPVVKLIDFGIAKALDQPLTDAQLTAHGVVVGTPSYLSPEAVEPEAGAGDPDTRSDVYSLGILLFELLTGTRPFGRAGDSYLQILRQVSEGEVPAPSARWRELAPEERAGRAAERATTPEGLARHLRGDLDWITLRATARRRDARYGSAAELADDLERHRRHEPVRAGPPSRLYALGKFVRRHRAVVIAGTLAFLALVAGIAARSLEAERANREAEAALRAQAETQQVVDFLVDLFRVSDPGTARGETITARELLDRGATDIRQQLADQPLTRARLLDTIGVVYRQLDLPQPAKPLLEEALALRERLLGPDHLDVASSLVHLGGVDYLAGEYEEAERALRRALEIRERALGPDHPQVADVLDHLGSVHDIQAEHDEAEPLLRRALAIRERALGPDDLEVAASLDDLGVLELDRGRFAEAEPLLRRGLEIRQERLAPDHPDVAVSANGLGIALFQLGRHEESAELHARALAIREKVFGPRGSPVAQSLNNLATVDLELGRREEARAALERAGEIWREILGPDHPRVGIVLTNLGDLALESGQPDAAEPLYRQAAGIFELGLGPDHPNLAYPLQGLAQSLLALDRPAEAATPCARAVAIRTAALGAEDPLTVSTADLCAGPP
ncbi:MAG TPA: serine/threonine-protein kinase [Thermoanaerobaculia bacterium]|nr:serine/threonine-protein kinase [Thermoanaerobaculia bacterium]